MDDNEILNYLMTSDYNEGLNSDEFRFFLTKFRYFYRILYAKHERIKNELENNIKEKEENKSFYDLSVNNLKKENTDLLNLINSLKNRKLTFKERLKGHLIIK